MLEITHLVSNALGFDTLVAGIGDVFLNVTIIDIRFLVNQAGKIALPSDEVVKGETGGIVLHIEHLLLQEMLSELGAIHYLSQNLLL